MRVLLIEDDATMARNIQLNLATEGIICEIAEIGEDGLEFSKLYDYDLIILDIKLPDVEGWEVLSKLRSSRIKTPVLILSGLTSTEDTIKGLALGADDFLKKPFDKMELIARINAIFRRSRGHAESILRFGDLSINLDARVVEVNGNKVKFTPKEYAIMELLAMRKGTVITKAMFLNHLYGGIDEPEIKIIDVFIFKIRQKLAEAAGDDGKQNEFIETVWGYGYMLKDPNNSDMLSGLSTSNSDGLVDSVSEDGVSDMSVESLDDMSDFDEEMDENNLEGVGGDSKF